MALSPGTVLTMKRCGVCHQVLPFESFAKHRDGLACRCRSCQNEYSKAHYRRNKRRHNQRRMANTARYRARNRRGVTAYLCSHHCVDCGEGDVRVLEFDHVRGIKESDISTLVRVGAAWQRIVREIAKCEVRCANCHRRRTVETLRWPQASGRSSAW